MRGTLAHNQIRERERDRGRERERERGRERGREEEREIYIEREICRMCIPNFKIYL